MNAIDVGFSPSEADVDWARRVIAVSKSGAGAVTVDGKLIDVRQIICRPRKF